MKGQKGEPKLKANEVYEIVTKKIVDAMESGNVPWRKPWQGDGPKNLFTKKSYRGINNWLLGLTPASHPYFATYKQVQEAGGNIIRGSKSTPVYFFTMKQYKDEKSGETKKFPIIRTYAVFTTDQMENIDLEKFLPASTSKESFEVMETAQGILSDYIIREGKNGFHMDHNGNDNAYYRPSTDSVHLPKREHFNSASAYYSTAFHEIGHSTGHAKRLNREGVTKTGISSGHFRGQVYSFEELVAEFTASFLCANSGIDNEIEIGQRAAYIKGWLSVLKDDPKMLWKAASAAQKASDFILDVKFSEEVANG